MPGAEDAGATLRRLGWYQGALIPIPSGSRVAEAMHSEATHAIVGSQDCDVVASTYTEPAVDLLPAYLRPQPENDLLYGKNPRRLCLPLGSGLFVTMDIRERVTVDKRFLVELAPLSEGPGPRERKLLAKWLAKRYVRPAFPDQFNERLRAARAKLDALAKKPDGRHVTAVLMMLDTEQELAADVDYRIVIWFACHSSSAEDPRTRGALEKYAQAFADAVGSCDGIEVEEHEVRSHLDITLEDLEEMKRFDFDYRSEAPKPGGDVVSDE
jgi:hypothetical protein